MKRTYKKWFLPLALVVIFVTGTVLAVSANTVNITVNNVKPLEETTDSSRVNWDKGSAGTIEAKGVGYPPPNTANVGYGQVLARRAAIVDAQRNLLECIQGIQLDAETTTQNLIVSSDTVRTRVSGMIKGAKVVREIPYNDGRVEVIMSVPMYGTNSMADVAFNALKPKQIENFPAPDPDFQYKPVDPVPPVQPVPPVPSVDVPDLTQRFGDGDYTGVVVDAGGLGLKSTFSPRIYDESGNIVYGNKYIDPDFAIKHGMVDYSGLDAARNGNSRAGAKPLIVKALRIVDNDYNVVISNEDAQRILSGHAQNGFLAKCAVVFAR